MEWITIAIGIGLLVSLIFTEAFGLSVGGMIVPGYLAMNFSQPLTVIATLAAAIVVFALVRLISNYAIVFGRRRVVLTMIVGFAVGECFRQILLWYTMSTIETGSAGASASDQVALASITVIGFVIPGLIALWIDRTSILQTLSPLITASGLVYLTLIAVGMEAFS